MHPRLSARAGAATAILLALAAGCDGWDRPGDAAAGATGGPPTSPEAAARALFALGAEPSDERLASLFVAPIDEASRVDLLETLDRLPRPGGRAVAIVATEPLETVGRIAVDVDLSVADGAIERYSVQVIRVAPPGPAEDATATWRIAWLQGPDLAWPRYRAPRGTGTSVSSVPGEDG